MARSQICHHTFSTIQGILERFSAFRNFTKEMIYNRKSFIPCINCADVCIRQQVIVIGQKLFSFVQRFFDETWGQTGSCSSGLCNLLEVFNTLGGSATLAAHCGSSCCFVLPVVMYEKYGKRTGESTACGGGGQLFYTHGSVEYA